MISVVIPTVTGRERFFEKAVESYGDAEILVFKDLDACGPAWVKGAEQAKGDYIHFGADDLEAHPGWADAATRFCDRGFLPAPRILNTDGSLQSCGDWEVELPEGAIPQFTRIPFVSRGQWEKLAPLITPFLKQAHYYTDNIFSWAGRRLGMQTAVCRRYLFTHHLAEVKRGAGTTWENRMRDDHQKFMDYVGMFK